jgi:CRISPR/Cas system-associated exonuclease Cas4 (RecB family)
LFSEIIAGYLKDQLPLERDYTAGNYYPGELPYCLRRQYFEYTQPSKVLSQSKESLFGLGNLWQVCVDEAFELAGVKVLEKLKIRKLKVPNSDLVLICEPDFVVDFEGKKIVVELKSVAALKSEPLSEHIFQVTAYIAVTKSDSAVIVYINKSTGEVREFPVAFEEDKLALLFERAKRLHRFVSEKELPPAAGAGQEWQCKSCDFQTECETFGADNANLAIAERQDALKVSRSGLVEFDVAAQVRDEPDALVVPAILARECVAEYCGGRGYKPWDELKAAAFTLDGAWVVTYNHIGTVHVHNRLDIRGKIANIRLDEAAHLVLGDVRFLKALCDKALLDKVAAGKISKDLSAAYFADEHVGKGTFGADAYDFVQKNFMYGHVAVGLPEGRCPSPYCGMQMDGFDNFLRVRVRDVSLFTCRLTSIAVDVAAGVFALVGKLKSNLERSGWARGDALPCEYMFDTAKGWTPERANAWIADHSDNAKIQAEVKCGLASQGQDSALEPSLVLAHSRKLLGNMPKGRKNVMTSTRWGARHHDGAQ